MTNSAGHSNQHQTEQAAGERQAHVELKLGKNLQENQLELEHALKQMQVKQALKRMQGGVGAAATKKQAASKQIAPNLSEQPTDKGVKVRGGTLKQLKVGLHAEQSTWQTKVSKHLRHEASGSIEDRPALNRQGDSFALFLVRFTFVVIGVSIYAHVIKMAEEAEEVERIGEERKQRSLADYNSDDDDDDTVMTRITVRGEDRASSRGLLQPQQESGPISPGRRHSV